MLRVPREIFSSRRLSPLSVCTLAAGNYCARVKSDGAALARGEVVRSVVDNG